VLRVGFIGGGLDSAIGRAHFGAINIDRKYSLDAGVFSIDKKVNSESADFYGVDPTRVYDDISTFIGGEKGRLDAAILLSPTPLHYEHITSLFDAGIPVISEKALCTNSQDAQRLAERVQQEKNFLSVTFTYTGYPMVREIRELVTKGLLGEVISIHVEMAQESFIRESATGAKPTPQVWRQLDYEIPSVTLDLGSHVVNLLEFISGDQVAKVSALANHAGEVSDLIDNVSAIGEMGRGTPISLLWNKVTLGKRNGLALSINGSKGALSWIQEEPELLRFAEKDGALSIIDRSHSMITLASESRYQRFKVGHPAGYIEAFANLYLDIADDLATHKAGKESENPFTHSAANSAHGLRVLEAIHQSAVEKKWVEIRR